MQKLLEGLYGIIQNQYQVDYKRVIRIYDNYAKNANCAKPSQSCSVLMLPVDLCA